MKKQNKNENKKILFYMMCSLMLHPGGISLSVYMMYVYIGTGAAALILLTVIVTLLVRQR